MLSSNQPVPIVPPPPVVHAAPEKADFVGLFHSATNRDVPWPRAVDEWARQSPTNQNMLRLLKRYGEAKDGPPGIMARVIEEVIKKVAK